MKKQSLFFIVNDRAYKVILVTPYFGFQDANSVFYRVRKWFHRQPKDSDGHVVGLYFNVFRGDLKPFKIHHPLTMPREYIGENPHYAPERKYYNLDREDQDFFNPHRIQALPATILLTRIILNKEEK